jgi:hypothetical protein
MQCSCGSTFCFVVVVVVVVVDALLNYCEFCHGCKSGSCVSRQIESRQFTSHLIRVDLRRINICVDLRRVNIRVDLRRSLVRP